MEQINVLSSDNVNEPSKYGIYITRLAFNTCGNSNVCLICQLLFVIIKKCFRMRGRLNVILVSQTLIT